MNDSASRTSPAHSCNDLGLDDENPRLPESLRGKLQSEILGFLKREGVLEEIAQSYLDNGFFQHEPLLVVQGNGREFYTVVEGNRRLAALKILHEAPEADGLHFIGIDLRRNSSRDSERFPASSYRAGKRSTPISGSNISEASRPGRRRPRPAIFWPRWDAW